jgi:hypothetical protein
MKEKTRERRNGIASDWVEQRSHVVFSLLSPSPYIIIYKRWRNEQKVGLSERCWWKMTWIVRMLIMIIFLVPIGDWLVFHRFFSLVRSLAQKDAERKEGKHNLFLAGREKKRRQRREKDFLHIILTFSRSRRFLYFSLSLFLFLRSTRKNRLIVSFYKFPCLSSLVRRAKSRRRARARAFSRFGKLPLVPRVSR